MKSYHAVLVVLALVCIPQWALQAQQKHALVIGNGDYNTSLGKLNNPVNDAKDMAAALQSLGFQVDTVLNATLEQMEDAAVRLRNKLSVSQDSYGFFFYAGHGVQADGVNYLLPVDARIPEKSFLKTKALAMQPVLDMLNDAGNALNVIVLDACRNLPAAWSRSADRGLSVVSRQPAKSIIMYATAAGKTADDGTGRNGLFTQHLLTHLKTPGLDVKEVFNRTGEGVANASRGEQLPASYISFYGTAYLGTKPAAAVQPAPSPAPKPAPVVPPAAPPPEGPVPNNMVRINGGTFMMGSPASEAGRDSDEVQHRVTVSSFYMGKYEVTQKEYQELMGTNPSSFKGDTLPVENVSWYDAINYCNARSRKEGLTPAYTVNGTDVTWNRNANGYRLPTEAEWEYACRAGTTTPFSAGNNITTSQANYDGNYPYNNNAKGTYREKTTAAGSFAPNAWGLYDMHGNVWEWCWDWYGSYSTGSQTDPAGTSSGSLRVLRGGGWSIYGGQYLRSAYRRRSDPSGSGSYLGFRVVRP